MANIKDNKNFECPFCQKSMNRKFSFERHKKNCEDRLKGKFIPSISIMGTVC